MFAADVVKRPFRKGEGFRRVQIDGAAPLDIDVRAQPAGNAMRAAAEMQPSYGMSVEIGLDGTAVAPQPILEFDEILVKTDNRVGFAQRLGPLQSFKHCQCPHTLQKGLFGRHQRND